MEIILIAKRSPAVCGRLHLGPRGVLLLFSLLVMLVAALAIAAFRYGITFNDSRPRASVKLLNKELEEQRQALSRAISDSQDNLDALALRLGAMQARMIRLDALGERLVQMAHLDVGEFDFSRPPGRGGPEIPALTRLQKVPDFLSELHRLSSEIDDRELKLKALEGLLMHRRLRAESRPTGSPVQDGWISSEFGWRTDPFNGKREFHEGLDITGKRGALVHSVAAGVVVFAGVRHGYGNVVEVAHGNGYSTLYAHNRRLLVKVGMAVRRGQVLAIMGSTGRSTGRHVHFEVHYHGKPVDPLQYMHVAR